MIDYKRRLQTVRSELLEIESTAVEVAKAGTSETLEQTDLARLSESVSTMARILVRVIDSLP